MIVSFGIDISRYQADFDPAILKERGVNFVMVRGMVGTFPDSRFPQHVAKLRAAGIPFGIYHYYREGPGMASPEQQAQAFFDYVEMIGDFGDLPPAGDIEEIDNPTLTESKIKLYFETVQALFDRVPFIYTRATVWDVKIGNAPWAALYPLWVAHYPWALWKGENHLDLVKNLPPTLFPSLPKPWKNAGAGWYIWQIIGKAPAAEFGVTGNYLDLDFGSDKLAPMLPPPPVDPPPNQGDFMPKFYVRTDLSNTYIQIRTGPGVNFPDVGDLPEGVEFDALDVQAADPLTMNSIWLKIKNGTPGDPNDPDHWVAWKHAGVVYCLKR